MHRYPRSKIVHLNWLLMSASSWRRLDESSYLLDEPHSDAFSPPNGLDPLDTQAFLSSDDDDEDEALSLPSAGVANVRGETPESQNDDEDVDIGEIDWGDAQDWGAADEEVDEFLAELGEDAAFTTDESDNERLPSHKSPSLTIVSPQIHPNPVAANGNENEIPPVKFPTQTTRTQTSPPTTHISVLVSQNESTPPTHGNPRCQKWWLWLVGGVNLRRRLRLRMDRLMDGRVRGMHLRVRMGVLWIEILLMMRMQRIRI
jgi:hypothetical protein